LFYGSQPEWKKHLHSFGEIAIFKHHTKIQSKIKNRGFPGFCVGPADDHKGNVYTFWNPITRSSVHSRSAVFPKKNYAEIYQLAKSEIAKQIAGIDEPDMEVYDEDDDTIPEDNDGNHLSSSRH
jgi:hypothetical protein